MNVLQINKLIFATHSHLPCNIIKFNTPRKVFFSLNPLSKYTLQSYSTESKLASGNQSNPDCLSSLSPLTEQSPLAKIIPQLFKIKLSAMVLCTTLTGFVIVPGIDLYCWTTIKLLGNTLLGTSLCSFSANAFNQWIEASFDAQMKRTEFRPLPLRRISLPNAFIASSMMGLSGVAYLYYFVSGVSSIIAASTIILYAGVYTPLKRMSIMNTWVGSIVGAFPPLIGWSAGLQSLSFVAPTPLFGWIPIFFLLYCWQFPHFFSLSWGLRREYARAGYRMCSLLNPRLATASSMRHTLVLFPLTFLFYYTGLANMYFIFIGSLINCILLLPAIDFKTKQDSFSARRLFFASLIHLPLFMAALFVLKPAP